MKIVIAPDSFKGSAASSDIATWIETGIHSVIPDCETVKIPIGDGGEGSLDAVLGAGFTAIKCEVLGPVGNRVSAQIAINGDTAFIEMAQASGLSQLPGGVKSALSASSYGTGQLILEALNRGVSRIILGVGGSATTDAGAGALQALGAKLIDKDGNNIAPGGAALSDCAEIDTSGIDPRVAKVSFTLASDVTNPLLGPEGTAHVFAPQKGATPADVEVLEESLTHFASLVGGDFASMPGAGAAGGFGFMAFAFLNAQAQSGIDVILDLVDFDSHLAGADYVITGEGKFDSQSVKGKAPWGIFQRASKQNIQTVLVAGQVNIEEAINTGYLAAYSLQNFESDLSKSISHPQPLLHMVGQEIAAQLAEI
jgi:glycerate kinase